MTNERLVWLTNEDARDPFCPAGCVIGKPKATATYTVAELEGFGMVGVYRVEEIEEETKAD